MAASAVAAAFLLTMGIADDLSASLGEVTDRALAISPWLGLLVVILQFVLIAGIIVVVLVEIQAIYEKWFDRAAKVTARGLR